MISNNKFEQRNSVQIKTLKSPGLDTLIKSNSGNKNKIDELIKPQLQNENAMSSNNEDMLTNYGVDNDHDLLRNNSNISSNKKMQKSMSAKDDLFQSLGLAINSNQEKDNDRYYK